MTFDFPTILVLITVFTGVVSLVDIIYSALINKKVERQSNSGKNKTTKKKPVIIEYSRAFFPVLLIVLLIRSFIAQPYQVPTASLEPTIVPGDFILVTQYNYGLRLPAWNKKIINIGEPKTGEIALFYWPVNPAVTFVKRVIGVPGDRVSYINKVLYINGKEAKQKLIGYTTDSNGPGGPSWKVAIYEENLNGVKHKIYVCTKDAINCPNREAHNFYNLVIPKGKYFMMGDNRDNSDDCRDWGFVPEKSFIGKALYVWMNWDRSQTNWLKKIRWDRIGTKL